MIKIGKIRRVLNRFFIRKSWVKKSIFVSKKSYFNSETIVEGKSNVADGCNIQTAMIGYATYIGKNSYLRKTKIGRYCSIGSNVKVLSNDHPLDNVSTHPAFHNPSHSLMRKLKLDFDSEHYMPKYKNDYYYVTIGHDVWVGDDVKIMPGIKVGNGAVIGTNSLVTKDVPPYSIVGGSPAKILKYRFNEDTVNYLLSLEWWSWSERKIKYMSKSFPNVGNFIGKDIGHYENNILVVLYNKSIIESSTLTTLLESNFDYSKTKIVIWNNGPVSLYDDFSDFLVSISDEIAIELVETLDNKSLSKIYNKFFENYFGNRYVILDDDSNITQDYLDKALTVTNGHVAVPIVTSLGKVISPTNYVENSKEKGINSRSIGSGLVLTAASIDALCNKYGTACDERFYFYGVDTTLCYRVNSLGIAKDYIPGFEHSVSEYNIESTERELFKRNELSYSFGLKLRNYPRLLLFKILISNIFFKKHEKLMLSVVIKAFLKNKHPRYKDE